MSVQHLPGAEGPVPSAAAVGAQPRMHPRPNVLQAAIAVTQTVVPSCVFAIVIAATVRPDHLLSLQTLFMMGTLVSALGVSAVLWNRVWTTIFLSTALLALGGLSLALMTVAPAPASDLALWTSGAWRAGAMPFTAGWDRYLVSVMMLAAGLALPLAVLSRTQPLELFGLTVGRTCLWYSALWQLGFLSLGGGFARELFVGTANIQLGMLGLVSVGWVLLLRGDRRWLGALTGFDRSVALGRFLMPLMLMPIVAAGLLSLAASNRAYAPNVSPVLNAELNSIVLVMVGLAALRGLWLERRQRSTLSRAVEASPVMIHSDKGLVEYWPRGCEVLFGYTSEEVVGRRAPDILHTEYPIPPADIEATIRRTGEWSGEVRQTARDGRRLWIATRVAIDRPEADSELKLVETMTDITALKLSTAALRDTIESLEQVTAGYGVGMADYLPISGRAQFSAQMERMLGLEEGGLGKDYSVWFGLIFPEDVSRVTALFMEDARRKAHGRTVLFKAMHADGQYRDLQGVLRYEYDPRNRLSRIFGVYMDVTEVLRDRMEMAARGARLLELQAELAHTSRLSAMGELAAGLAHELNQPLAAVGTSVGAIEMMLRDEDKPLDTTVRQRLLRAARLAEKQAVRAGEIVRRLREFISRGEADTQVEDLARLVDDSLALALPSPAASGVEVSKLIDPAATCVLADRIQVQQVLVNLIRNAVQAMDTLDRAHMIRIVVEVRGEMSLVRVIDNGAGVTADRMSTLFSPFVSSKRDGMGVGLSICRRLIEGHGGELWFEPAEGGGADFRFTLPLAKVDA